MEDSSQRSHDPSPQAQQAYWDDRWGEQRTPNEWQSRRGQAILAMIRELPLDRPRILDLGCATGWMTSWLSELGNAEGVDLSPTAIEQARARFPGIKFTSGNLYEVELTDEPVDVVVCQEVIAHVSDQAELIRRIVEVLKPGGYLVITAANRIVMERVRDSDGLVGVGDADPKDHIKKWLDMKGLKRLLESDFEILQTTSVIPMGHRGFLRIVNSPRLAQALGWLVPQDRLDAWKEKMGLGYSIIAMGRKKP